MAWPPRLLLCGLAGLCACLAAGDTVEAAGEAPAFLGAELPLRILSVLPSARRPSPTTGTRLGGRAALTVVYSRAVIALGADWSAKGNDGILSKELVPFRLEACEGQPTFAVPGKIRWSTTAIARFDPDVDWPTDLCFRLVPNLELRTFDGLQLAQDAAAGWLFTTRHVSVSLRSVRSEKAKALTGGRWTSRTFRSGSGERNQPHECPPDATVSLSFSSDLDHSAAFAALQQANAAILPTQGKDAYEACGPRCLAVRPRGLESGVDYKLVLPRGSRYGRISGTSGEEQHVLLTGLVPFAFPFWFKTPPAHEWENRKLRYRRHLLYLRHGLQPESSNLAKEAELQALKGAITVSTADGASLDYALSRRDNATLMVETFKLEPGKRYKIEVTGTDSVRDGFGQPLQSSSMEFDTEDWPDDFVEPEESPAYFRHSPGNWTVLARGDGNTWCGPAEGSYLHPMSVATLVAPMSAPAPPPMAPPVAEGTQLRELSDECHPYEVRAWPVRIGEIVSAIAQRYNQQQSFLPTIEHVEAQAPLTNELRPVELDERRLLIGGDSGTPRRGLFLREVWRSAGSASKGFVSVAPFGVAFVATESGELLVWATNFASGVAVTGAAITVYRLEKSYNTQPADVTRIAEGSTGKDGFLALTPADSQSWLAPGSAYAQLVAIAEAPDGALAYSERVPLPLHGRREKSTRAELVTDRSIYRPGDTVHVKGYVRTLRADGAGYELPSDEEASFSFEVQWKRSAPGHASADTIKVDAPLAARYGTVSAELHVPSSDEEVSYGDIQVSLLRTPSSKELESASVATSMLTVADPRPPTVTLNISTDAKVVLPGPAASLDVDISAATYSGSGVEGAKVELTWRLHRARGTAEATGGDEAAEVTGMACLASPSPSSDGLSFPNHPRPRHTTSSSHSEEGKVTVVTGHLGKGSATLSLASLLESAGQEGGPAPPCAEGDELSLSARWVGPTREVVTAKLEGGPLRVARSPYVLALTPSRPVDADAGTPLPGTPFAVYVDLRDMHGHSLQGAKVNLSLHEWDGAAAVHEDPTSEVPVSASAAELQRAALRPGLRAPETWGKQVDLDCEAEADGGKEAQCASTLTLPEAKKYVVLARAHDPDGVELVTAFAVGRTPDEWKRQPLSSLDAAVTVRTDKPSYAVGDAVKLSMASPFKDAAALLIWGNGAGRQTKQQRLAGAPGTSHTVELKLGEECAYGCSALVLLAAPDQPQEVVLPVKVPVSPLLDVTLPRTIVKHVRIDVPDTKRAFAEGSIQLAVAKRGGSGEEAAAVLRPGDEAEVSVRAPESAAGAEVCLFVVDRAMLDVGGSLHPHSLEDLAKRFELTRGENFEFDDTRSGLASAEGYRQTVATAMRRAEVDPWAWDMDWPLRHGSMGTLASVEQSDKDYFAGHADEATHFPSPDFFGGTGAGMEVLGMPMFKSRVMPMALATLADAPVLERGAMPEMEADMADEAMPAPAPPPLLKARHARAHKKPARRASGGEGQLGKEAFTRTQFETTPLFKASAVVGDDGTVTVPFKLPDNIATFEVRAYMVDGAGEHKFGRAETSFVARRDVSLVPSVPRVVRPGDRFECGVSVTGHVPQEAGGTGLPDGGVAVLAQTVGTNASVALRRAEMTAFKASEDGDGLKTMLSPSEKGGSPQEVIFPFEAPSPDRNGSLGTTTLRFTARLLSGEVADGLEAKLAVKPLQAPVLVATSLSIAASPDGSSEASEGLDLPEAMPGSGQLALTAGVGHLPAVVADSASLLRRHRDNGQVLVASLVPAAALAAYFAPDASQEANASAGLEAAAAAFQEAVGRLPAYTITARQPPLGLVWRREEGERLGGYTPRASVSLNSFGLLVAHLVSQLATSPLLGNPPSGSEKSAWAALRPAVPEQLAAAWRAALERELEREVLDLHFHSHPRCSSDCFTSWETLAQVRAALGFDWVPSNQIVAQELSMDRLFAESAMDSLSPMGLAYAALAYTLHSSEALPPAQDQQARERLEKVYSLLAARVRVQGRTAYVAASQESPHTAGLEANAVVVLALAHAGARALAKHFADNAGASLAARLAAHVADGAGAGRSALFGGGEWMGTREAALAAAALAAFDVAHGSARPDLKLSASSGTVSVLEYEARDAGAPPAAASLPWERLQRPPKPLRFEASGRGQVSVVAALDFVPASLPVEGAVYRGLYVEKAVRRMDPATGEPMGPTLDVVRLGESVVVTIQVTTPDDVARITLEDLSAGGLEPVDPKVAGDVAGSSASGGCGGAYGWSWWCLPAFHGRETYADRVTWSSGERLPAGTHTVSYQAVAATRGVFSLPPAHAYAEDQPELMGLSQAGTLIVSGTGCAQGGDAGGVEETPDAVLQRLGVQPSRRLAPRGCPGGCPHGGVCQLATGKCGCYRGFSFIDGDCPAPALAPSRASQAVEDAARLFLQSSAAVAAVGAAGPSMTAALSACALGALLLATAWMAHAKRWFSRAANVRFQPCREQPYTSMEMMEQQ